MSLRRKISILAARLTITCDRATQLMAQNPEEKISFSRQLQVRLHLLTCKACRNFYQQMTYLSRSVKGINKKLQSGKSLFPLSSDAKALLEKELRDKLKE